VKDGVRVAVNVNVGLGVSEKMRVWLGVRVSPVAVGDGVGEEVNVSVGWVEV
jgi:hypothetical protein